MELQSLCCFVFPVAHEFGDVECVLTGGCTHLRSLEAVLPLPSRFGASPRSLLAWVEEALSYNARV